ncbi:MAG: class I SAM-dependent methyltransferase [Acidimicrobiales bacterium]
MASPSASLRPLIAGLLGEDPPIAIRAYDGTELGPPDAPAAVVINSKAALIRILQAPGELGFVRAYVAGDLDIEGDLYAALVEQDRMADVKLSPTRLAELARAVGLDALHRLPPPPEEARIRGRRHSRERDAAAIAHHYDVSNEFYRLFLGPTMTYSCAVFEHDDDPLDLAQEQKYELICRKLGLEPGMRLLDVGCGWGGMVMHAARRYGVEAVGITVSQRQVELARQRVVEAGLGGKVEIRFQDYRDVSDGPFDAVSSIGMFEHVGAARLSEYFTHLSQVLRPGGRLLNHAIARPPYKRRLRGQRPGLMNRYVFPDGEALELGQVISALQRCGFEARHEESLREHYARTLRAWVANLEANWEAAVAEVGLSRARVWRLYMAGSAVNFERGTVGVHQVLAVNQPPGRGPSGLGWRPRWDAAPLSERWEGAELTDARLAGSVPGS